MSVGLLALAYFYFKQHLGLELCPLCMLQCAALVAIASICIMVWLHQPGKIWAKIYSSVVIFISLIGLGLAGRQVWLQNLPVEKVSECDFNPIVQWMESNSDFSFIDMLLTSFRGAGDCVKVDWAFLGLSAPVWMMIIFLVSALTAHHVFKKQRRFFS